MHLTDYCAQLRRFVNLHGNDMKRLRECLTTGEHNLAHDIACNIKEIAQLIGARRIASLSAELIRQLRAGADHASIVILSNECEAEFARLLDAI